MRSLALTAALSCIVTHFYRLSEESGDVPHYYRFFEEKDPFPALLAEVSAKLQALKASVQGSEGAVEADAGAPQADGTAAAEAVGAAADLPQVAQAAARLGELEQELQALRQRPARDARAGGGDPVSTMASSASQLLRMIKDMTLMALEPLTAYSPSSVDSYWRCRKLFFDIAGAAGEARTVVCGVLPEGLQAAGAEGSAQAQAAVTSAREGVASWLKQFTEQYPRHRQVINDRDPLLILLACLGMVAIALLQLYTAARLVWYALQLALQWVRCLFGVSTCACRRESGAKKPQEQQEHRQDQAKVQGPPKGQESEEKSGEVTPESPSSNASGAPGKGKEKNKAKKKKGRS